MSEFKSFDQRVAERKANKEKAEKYRERRIRLMGERSLRDQLRIERADRAAIKRGEIPSTKLQQLDEDRKFADLGMRIDEAKKRIRQLMPEQPVEQQVVTTRTGFESNPIPESPGQKPRPTLLNPGGATFGLYKYGANGWGNMYFLNGIAIAANAPLTTDLVPDNTPVYGIGPADATMYTSLP